MMRGHFMIKSFLFSFSFLSLLKVTNLGDGNGLAVTLCEETGAAARHGVCKGDRVVEINGRSIPRTIQDDEFLVSSPPAMI